MEHAEAVRRIIERERVRRSAPTVWIALGVPAGQDHKHVDSGCPTVAEDRTPYFEVPARLVPHLPGCDRCTP
jgi:hypothetical protein